MSKKLTHQFVYEEYKKNNFELLDTYINNNIRLNYTCLKCGYHHHKAYQTFTKNKDCNKCTNKYHSFTEEYVRETVEAKGWKLNSKYKNTNIPLDLICPDDHKCMMRFSGFLKGNNCSICAGNSRKDIDFVRNKLKDNGFELLDENYKNNRTKLNVKCIKKGHIITKELAAIQNGYTNCEQCIQTTQKIKFDAVRKMVVKSGYTLKTIENDYTNIRSDITVVCPENHEYTVRACVFKRGIRCSECYKLSCFGSGNPNWNTDRTRLRRTQYLQFNRKNDFILKNDINYNNYINTKKKVKLKLLNKNNYEIDHIYPRVAFINNDLDLLYDKLTVKRICNLRENLQIIEKKDNISKFTKYNQEEFMFWFNDKIKEYT